MWTLLQRGISAVSIESVFGARLRHTSEASIGENSRIVNRRTRHSRMCVILLATLIASIVESGCGGSTVATSSSIESNTPVTDGLADISIGTTPGPAISPTFMGLSHEWGTAQAMMGDSTVGVNLIYRQLLTNLTAYGSGPIILRIGGNSTDETGEPTACTVQPFAEIANALGVHFYLGVNLGSDNVNLATDQAKAYLKEMPAGSVDAIEIGNEPDNYVSNGMRPAPYTFQDYVADFDTWGANITPLLPPGTRLLGASWGSTGMLSNVSVYDADEGNALAAFSQHYYVGNGAVPQPDDLLLTPDAATSGPEAVAAAVTATHGYGLPFRMGEINSLYNGGAPGISNTFGAALWAVDTMFEYANAGVDGVNWHSGNGGPYGAFEFSIPTLNSSSAYALSSVTPLYYGMLFFQAATGNRAQLLPVNLSTQANLKAWATVDSSETPRLVIINKDEILTGTAEVTLSGYSHASILRLTAPSYQSTTGVTFAGQTFDGSTDGTIQGARTIETIDGDNGIFQIPMPITNAALVVFTK